MEAVANNHARTLAITDMDVAHDRYDAFVNVHFPVLSLTEFVQKRQLPLNEQCASVFFDKTAHLTDSDFIEIDRPILEMIGFKNTWVEQKDKHGNIKVDQNGQPILKDNRNDFTSAIRCLKNTTGFVQGYSFEDVHAHFIIEKIGVPDGTPKQRGGKNKQSLWIRLRALEHFVIMANTANSFMIREYFLDLKRIMTEYAMYQTVYQAKYDLSLKDTTIGNLYSKLDHVIQQNDELLKQNKQLFGQNETQCAKLDMLSRLFYKDTDNKVLDVATKRKKQELVILQNKKDPSLCEVLRGQANHVNQQLKKKRNDMEIVGKIDTYKNPINLYNRFGEAIKKEGDDRFERTNNKITLKGGCTVNDLMNVLHVLEDDKHNVAVQAKECL